MRIISLIFLLIYQNYKVYGRTLKSKLTVVCVNQHVIVNNTMKGKFYCPEPGKDPDLYHCCGIIGEQFCCDPQDTPGFKWGIAVAVIVGVLVLLAIGYTIQVFRACDNCYHECPICELGQEEEEFQWDTRWYSVSHEGNRYGVTFHSHKFAKHFMEQLESRHGPWNTANILRIRKEGQDFVVLNIFFHDLFTPWFYTQGPIKNDEEWIRTDFRTMCQVVKDTISVKPCACFFCCKKETLDKEIIIKPIHNEATNATNLGQRRVLKPWTKTTYRGSDESSSLKLTNKNEPSNNIASNQNKRGTPATKSVIVLEDIIEVYGNSKAIQTKREIVVKTY